MVTPSLKPVPLLVTQLVSPHGHAGLVSTKASGSFFSPLSMVSGSSS